VQEGGSMEPRSHMHADLVLYAVSSRLSDEVLTKYPGLKSIKEKVEALPNIAKWLKERPDTPF